ELHAAVARLSPAGAVRWAPAKLVPGSPVLFQIAASKDVQEITAYWFGHKVMFFLGPDASRWDGLAGGAGRNNLGNVEPSRREASSNSRLVEIHEKIRIASAAYPKIAAKVAKQFTEPNPEQLKEISADKELKQQTFAGATPQRLWQGSFVPPVSAPVSDLF